jgi:hypothetical protein
LRVVEPPQGAACSCPWRRALALMAVEMIVQLGRLVRT